MFVRGMFIFSWLIYVSFWDCFLFGAYKEVSIHTSENNLVSKECILVIRFVATRLGTILPAIAVTREIQISKTRRYFQKSLKNFVFSENIIRTVSFKSNFYFSKSSIILKWQRNRRWMSVLKYHNLLFLASLTWLVLQTMLPSYAS